MRCLRLLVSVLALVLFASACGGNTADRVLEGAAADIFGGTCAAGEGQDFSIYTARTENLIEPVLNAFSCETGIDVAVRWGDSTQLALLLDEEGDRTPADIFLSRSPGPVGFLEARGLLGTIDEAVLGLVAQQNSLAGSNLLDSSNPLQL